MLLKNKTNKQKNTNEEKIKAACIVSAQNNNSRTTGLGESLGKKEQFGKTYFWHLKYLI